MIENAPADTINKNYATPFKQTVAVHRRSSESDRDVATY